LRNDLLLAVPESIHKDLVVLDSDWAHRAIKLKCSLDGSERVRTHISGLTIIAFKPEVVNLLCISYLLKHNSVLIVDTCAFRKNQERVCVWIFDVLLQPEIERQKLRRVS
jgi:hypothetical protein